LQDCRVMLPHGAGVPVMLRHARRLVGLLGSWGEGGQLGHGSGEDSTVPRRVDVKAAPGGIWREGSSVCPDQQVPGDERAVVRVVNDGLEAALSRSGCITAADLEACCVPSVPCDRCILLGSSERCLQPDRELPELERRTRGRTVLMAACGGLHSAAVTDEGLLFTWGAGSLYICVFSQTRAHTLTSLPCFRVLPGHAVLMNTLTHRARRLRTAGPRRP